MTPAAASRALCIATHLCLLQLSPSLAAQGQLRLESYPSAAWGKWSVGQVASGNLSEMREATTAKLRCVDILAVFWLILTATRAATAAWNSCPSPPTPSSPRSLFMASSCGRCHFVPLLHLPFDIICISPKAEIRSPDGPATGAGT